ncbi:MAG: cupin domain-containing protein [Candidatus Sericytochromatia bacterium]|nr:cupin domain-containing protein [Candidatus Sericytochromatia bacterium]
MAPKPFLLNADDVGWERRAHGQTAVEEQHLSLAMRSRKLSYGITAIAPGARSFPFHFHHDNEEMFVILSGTGQVRIGDIVSPIRSGDVISCPAGPGGVHQFINDGAESLRYLAVGTMAAPDVIEYPDSDKVNVIAGTAAGGDKGQRTFSGVFPKRATVDYWEGEA